MITQSQKKEGCSFFSHAVTSLETSLRFETRFFLFTSRLMDLHLVAWPAFFIGFHPPLSSLQSPSVYRVLLNFSRRFRSRSQRLMGIRKKKTTFISTEIERKRRPAKANSTSSRIFTAIILWLNSVSTFRATEFGFPPLYGCLLDTFKLRCVPLDLEHEFSIGGSWPPRGSFGGRSLMSLNFVCRILLHHRISKGGRWNIQWF